MTDGVATDRTSLSALIGLTLHALLAFAYLLAGLFVSLWTATVLWTVWTAILVLAVTQRRHRPRLVAVLPLVTLGVWLMAVSAVAA